MADKFFTFRASTLDQAYRAMRAKLGQKALVVRTATVTEGGVMGFFGRKLAEVTASAPAPKPDRRTLSPAERKYMAVQDETAPRRPKKAATITPSLHDDQRMHETVAYFKKIVQDAQGRMKKPRSPGAGPAPITYGSTAPKLELRPASEIIPFARPEPKPVETSTHGPALKRDVEEIRDMMKVLFAEIPGAGLPPEFTAHYRRLLERGLPRETAARLVTDALKNADPEVLRVPNVFQERLKMEVRKRVSVTGGIRIQAGQCRKVAFIGPTGAGKTTNLAKLAALFAVREHARVGLITADTYRVGATAQLRAYANIIGVPMKVVHDARETRDALRDMAAFDLVLIDTAGSSPYNDTQKNEAKAVLEAAQPHETMLLLPAPTPVEDLRNALSRFADLAPASVFFTKLDETRRYGPLFAFTEDSGLPLSYFSTGQNVPDDIALAHPGMLAEMVMKGGDRRGAAS